MLNIGRVVLVSNETQMYVYTLCRIYSSRYLDTLLYKVELKMHRKCSSIYTNATIEEKG